MTLRAKARSSGLSRMVIWPVSPRSKSVPARRSRSGVGSARRSTSRSFRLLIDFRTRISDRLVRSLIFPPPVDRRTSGRFGSRGVRTIVARGGRRSRIAAHARVDSAAADRRARNARRSTACSVRGFAPQKKKSGTAGIADRPPAGAAAQFEQRATLRSGMSRVEERIVDVRPAAHHPRRQRALLRIEALRRRDRPADSGMRARGHDDPLRPRTVSGERRRGERAGPGRADESFRARRRG